MAKEREKISFYDVKSKDKFITDDYRIVKKKAKGRERFFAVTKSLVGPHECWRVVSKDFADANK